jgi:radical SAM superfamily enzyme YgiQ (UPF0313 family)
MAKVLFLYPNVNAQEGFNHGIAALSGNLKADGHETRLIHLSEALYGAQSLDEIADQVLAFDPHLICFSVMSQQYKHALEIARYLKSRFPYPLALGGVHATMVPEEVAQDGIFDYIGLGECDRALPALVNALWNDRNPSAMPNFWVKSEEGGYTRNLVGPFPELATLPPKDYELFDLDRMLSKMNGWMSMITSRGCPYRCAYCFNHQFLARYRKEAGVKPAAYLRRYPIERIINDMERLKTDHPAIRTFIIDDDLFTMDEDYVIDFCDAYIDRGLGTPFVVNAHVQSFTAPMAAALQAAGCKILKFGVESGSERIRTEVLRRKMSNAAIRKAFDIAHEAGLHTSAFIMIGLPLEKREDLQATIDLLAEIQPGRFRWAVFYPFPGTDIHTLCEQEGLLDPEKMARLDNFYEASPLRLDPELDLWIRKLQRCLHWYVNARSALPCAPLFQERVAKLEGLGEEAWSGRADNFLDEDRRLSEDLQARSELHYSLRFIQVMAVRSDYTEDDDGLAKPVKEWKSKPKPSV